MSRIERIKESTNDLTDGVGLVREYAERILLLVKDVRRDMESVGILDIPYYDIDLRIGMMREDLMDMETAMEDSLSKSLKAYVKALCEHEEGGVEAC